VFYKFKKKLNLWYFNSFTMGIREKAHVTLDKEANFAIATMLCNTDINMYLLSVASFCRFIKPSRIVVVSDRLSEENCNILRKCVEGIEIVPVEEYREPSLPVGGCWERLTYITQQVEDIYTVQLDADILTLQQPDEVINAINSNTSFSLTTKLGFEKMSFVNASYLIWERQNKHVQNEAEKSFKDCANAENRKYLRACAGFAGYAKKSYLIDTVIDFSSEIEEKIGREKWSEWGSEQVTSNYIIANTPDSVILPYETYPFYEPGIDESDIKVLHFIGTHRFKKGRYLSLARKFIDSL